MPTVLITGCDRGLGLEFARQYAADDWRVIATALDPDRSPELAAITGITVRRLDVTDFATIDTLAAELAGTPIDLLVSNAALARQDAPLGRIDYDVVRRMVETNALGPLRLAEAFREHVAASELRAMAFVSSRMGSITLNATGGVYGYRASKAALNMFVKSLSVDLRPSRITVLALHPGWAKTEPGARVEVDDSVRGMRRVIHRASEHETGSFYMFNDTMLPW